MLRLVYRSLLRLHPARFRRRFGEEMLSIFDQVEDRRAAAKLVADGFISFWRQWVSRPEHWEEQGSEPAQSSADGVPVFYTFQSFTPRTSALIDGGILTLLIFCAVCLALKYNWTHPVHIHFSGIRLETSSEDRPTATFSAMFPVDGTRVRPERPSIPPHLGKGSSGAVQPPVNRPPTLQLDATATPADLQAQATSDALGLSDSAGQVATHNTRVPLREEHVFARELAVGRFYFLRGNYPAAVNHYRSALDLRPNHPDATFGLAESLEKSGWTAEAQSAYRAYLKTAPDGQFAERSKAALRRLEQSAPR
jgi:hypothetical protein